MVVRLFAVLLLAPMLIFAQAESGELRLSVKDPTGLVVSGRARVTSAANQYDRTFGTDAKGQITVKRLPFGRYDVSILAEGFAPAQRLVNIQTALPTELNVTLEIGPVSATVNVTAAADDQTLLDPSNYSSANRLGNATLEDRLTAQPGRSLAELVNQEPGWVFEANGILHPRAEEYQTQYVVDGLPLTENRSAAYMTDFDANNAQEVSVYTAGFPAEYGRKMGGVIEVETQRNTRPGWHGSATVSGGSFATLGGYLDSQYGWGKNTLTASASASSTDRYLDPPVLQNYTNHGALADFMLHYERDLTDKDRIGVVLRREQSKFLVPDELVQQAAGQRQDRNSFESAAQFSYQHIFSANVLGNVRAMTRDLTARLWSNDLSTPVIAGQDRGYHEAYVKATLSVHAGAHEIKTGFDSDNARIEESLNYLIADPSQFDPGTPQSFRFYGRHGDYEQGVFAQDEIHWKNVTMSAGLRFDHYALLVDQSGWSPRFGMAVYWPATKLVFRASYDRVFQTPAFENILVASSPAVVSLSTQVLRLPIEPARGNYYQAGFGRSFLGKFSVNGNFFWRRYHNYPDDDLLLNTGVSFPTTFALANIYGVEAKVEVPHWGKFSGYADWSNLRGNGYFPLTGGLFLGSDAEQAISASSGWFPVTQDQRNTVRTRVRYQLVPRVWLAGGMTYDSGLPIEFSGTLNDAEQQYGQAILDRVNFAAARPRPNFSLNASLGILLRSREHTPLRLQIDGANLTDQIHVIDFAGLFSGTAIGISRSVNARLQFQF